MFNRINEGRWWDFGWQLVEGCTPVSEGCDNCWSLVKEKRFRKECGIVFHTKRLPRPLVRKKPASYAIWNDLFHEEVPFELIHAAFAVMALCPQHIFFVLTKRPERMKEYFEIDDMDRKFNLIRNWTYSIIPEQYKKDIANIGKHPLSNVILGATAENQEQADKRIPILLQIPAARRFVSIEPMLGPVSFKDVPGFNRLTSENLNRIRKFWVVVGSESGPGRRECKEEWVESIIDQCKIAGVPVFVKQLHRDGKLVKMPEINGKTYNQLP